MKLRFCPSAWQSKKVNARAEIGAGVLQALHRVAGAGCTSPEGDVALQMLQEELPGLEGQRLQVLPQGPGHVLTLPGEGAEHDAFFMARLSPQR